MKASELPVGTAWDGNGFLRIVEAAVYVSGHAFYFGSDAGGLQCRNAAGEDVPFGILE